VSNRVWHGGRRIADRRVGCGGFVTASVLMSTNQ
jgi:hypothetical protein